MNLSDLCRDEPVHHANWNDLDVDAKRCMAWSVMQSGQATAVQIKDRETSEVLSWRITMPQQSVQFTYHKMSQGLSKLPDNTLVKVRAEVQQKVRTLSFCPAVPETSFARGIDLRVFGRCPAKELVSGAFHDAASCQVHVERHHKEG